MEMIKVVIHKMIVMEKSMRISIDEAQNKIISEIARKESVKIREAGKKSPGYSPSLSVNINI